jgi:TatD DNase family protein
MLIDTHAHLDMKEFDGDRESVLERAINGGISHIITVGIDLESSQHALKLAHAHDMIYATVGCHPHNADRFDARHLDRMAQIASDPKVVGWGEIGLDFFRRYASPEHQKKSFRLQLEISRDLNLPVVIHDREAHDEVLQILTKMGKGENRGVIHCFSGDVNLAEHLLKLGYFISIPGTLTYPKADQVRAVASTMPLNRMLVETDSPFLAPVPKRGKRNEPLFVTFTAHEIARLRGIPFEEVALATSSNARTLFGLPG